jgi:hypothetical protein
MDVDAPAWNVTTLFGRLTALSYQEGRWSVVVDTGSGDGDSLDDALRRAFDETPGGRRSFFAAHG